MARKRKIPARKHHGVRDPLKQLEEREKKLKNVVNNPPVSANDQKVSFKFAQFKKLADNAKAGKKFKRIRSGQEDKPAVAGKNNASASGSNKLRQIKQMYDESDEDYLRRVNRVTSESLREAQYEAKYGVNVVRDAKTGAITIKKRPKNEIDELLKQKQQQKHNGNLHGKKGQQAKDVKPMDPKMAKELIKRAIKEDEEEKMKESLEVEEYKRDVFKFGEVVHAPPTLSTLPRKAVKSETVPRPGKKSNLLLKSLLSGDSGTTVVSTTSATGGSKKQKQPRSGAVTKAQLKGKRKDLPVATRRMLEGEQSKIIELYRNLKKSKVKAN